MDLSSLDWTWYIPKLDGNREAAGNGQVAVELKTPSYGAIRTLATARLGAPPEQRAAADRAYFTGHVRAVRGLTLDGAPVTSGAELWRLGVDENRIGPDLFLELFQALDSQAMLREGLVLGLSGRSGSGAIPP